MSDRRLDVAIGLNRSRNCLSPTSLAGFRAEEGRREHTVTLWLSPPALVSDPAAVVPAAAVPAAAVPAAPPAVVPAPAAAVVPAAAEALVETAGEGSAATADVAAAVAAA